MLPIEGAIVTRTRVRGHLLTIVHVGYTALVQHVATINTICIRSDVVFRLHRSLFLDG